MNKKQYLSPKFVVYISYLEELLCTSPVEGGIEGTTDEDWVI